MFLGEMSKERSLEFIALLETCKNDTVVGEILFGTQLNVMGGGGTLLGVNQEGLDIGSI
jgi:hypothetical protein